MIWENWVGIRIILLRVKKNPWRSKLKPDQLPVALNFSTSLSLIPQQKHLLKSLKPNSLSQTRSILHQTSSPRQVPAKQLTFLKIANLSEISSQKITTRRQKIFIVRTLPLSERATAKTPKRVQKKASVSSVRKRKNSIPNRMALNAQTKTS